MKWKFIVVPILILLIISASANVYLFNKFGDETEQKNNGLLKEKDEQIIKLQDELSKLKHTSSTENEKENETNSKVNPKNISSEKEHLTNTAKRYLEFAFNINPDNYVTAKQNAHNYMTDEMVEFLFASDGVDKDFYMQIKNVKVYTTNEKKNEVITYYESEIETYETNYVEKNYNYVLLQFKEEDGVLKISNISPINVAGAN
jgi:hypothetical protein